MQPLKLIETLTGQINALLEQLPVIEQPLHNNLQTRRKIHSDLASYWSELNPQGLNRRQSLIALRQLYLLAEIDLRVSDDTLSADQAAPLRACIEHPRAWQRQQIPAAKRPQVYRPVLENLQPHWRSYLPGAMVIISGTAEGTLLEADAQTGEVLLCCLSQGIEVFPSLKALHDELCERLDDPIQSKALLHLYADQQSAKQARLAARLRYEWYADDPIEAQVLQLIDTQRQRLNLPSLWDNTQTPSTTTRHAQVMAAIRLDNDLGTQATLNTRYSRLLEKHMPAWLRDADTQSLSHIMQTMQELVVASEMAAAPGILTQEQFLRQNDLRTWTRARLQERLRDDFGLQLAPQDITVSITRARQVGPQPYPFNPSLFVTWHGLKQVGDETIEMVTERLPLDDLALVNLAWFNYDYWLTARVSHVEARTLPPAMTPTYVKTLVRSLNAGGGYADFLHTQLVDSRAGRWRLHAHARINRARMRAEAVKARYAGHFAEHRVERGYRWATAVLDQPDNALRAPVDGHAVTVRQLLIKGHTVQGVLLINTQQSSVPSFLMYTPEAPDRRNWREFSTTRQLLRTLRDKPALRQYLSARLPQVEESELQRLLLKGGLGSSVSMPAVTDDLFFAVYMAEVRAQLAAVDASSQTTREVNVQSVIDLSWRLLDLVSLVLPAKALMALSIGRMVLDICDGIQAHQRDDMEGVLRHFYNTISHATDAGGSFIATGILRRAVRGLPKQPPLPLPARYRVNVDTSTLRYRIDGVHDIGVYEQVSSFGGLSQYFVRDNQGSHYKVSFDGKRWQVIDPEQPDAYLQQPIKRLRNGQWVVDSPVLWYDGLPDLPGLLGQCRLQPPLAGTLVAQGHGVQAFEEQYYLPTRFGQVALRRHLLEGYWHLLIPGAEDAGVVPWAVLRWHAGEWQIRLRQAGRASAWLALPVND
ncbi:hypothetical protein J2W83_002911 [Pseudomonas hunanensis]|uniref:Uncharacterized protein n=1 Tax=Pseudomonas hunanensis TaxID=1247546 RepID=A0ACC6K4E5_9PSED|nr:DUF6543 domain-containing protein [Pseudomonas hunanensis]MDR6713303.1 hypothetical protein [Pseudomonas hunanensis]